MTFKETYLRFGELTTRPYTDMLVIHHTGERDIDASAEQIHQWHINKGWVGIGYHFVIRKNGTVERGRPEWATGSHAYGENFHTLGIHVSGDFESAQPTAAQINACAELVRDLCRDYKIPCDRTHIIGHCDLMPTSCPGKNLYDKLDLIIAKANETPTILDDTPAKPVSTIYDLAARYESNSNCAATGKFFGIYQFSRQTVDSFLEWLKDYPDKNLANYGKYLAEPARNLADAWQYIGTVDPGHFTQLQEEFAKIFFYDETAALLAKENYTLDKHSLPLQAVVFARAIQHGVFGCVELFKRACPYPNLSYADAPEFDRELIAAVYDYLIDNPNYGLANHDLDYALQARFRHEKADALA